MREKDMLGERCDNDDNTCGGIFIEATIHDDWEGFVTCDKCGLRIKRWAKVIEGGNIPTVVVVEVEKRP